MLIDKQRQLKKHKTIATGLFVLMAIVFIICHIVIKSYSYAWLPYVKAFSEAAMVGALADWFAVTALFKYPMGIKIPHTNLIQSNKDKIGANLGQFVTENFLTSTTIRPYIEKLNATDWLIQWLDKPKSFDLISNEIFKLIKDLVEDLDLNNIVVYTHRELINNLDKLPVNQITSNIIDYILENEEHNKLIDKLLPEVKAYILNNEQDIYNRVVDKQPILALIGGKLITAQLVEGFQSYVEEVQNNPKHSLRLQINAKISSFKDDLESDKEFHNKVIRLIQNYLDKPESYEIIHDVFTYIKQEFMNDVLKEDSKFKSYIRESLEKFAKNFRENSKQQSELNALIQYTIYKMALKNTSEITHLIERTVGNWDAKELSDKLELEVGKDLQYIRINGTLVGGIVGLLIYVISCLI